MQIQKRKFGVCVFLAAVVAAAGILIGSLTFGGDGKVKAAFDGVPVAINEGGGTEANPYQIDEAGQLLWLAGNYSGGNDYYSLQADLDMSNVEFPMIGGTQSTAFKGTFLGNGHFVSNIKISQEAENAYGFFGFIEGGRVEGLNLVNCNIEFINENGSSTGAVAGSVFGGGVIEDCSVQSSRITAYSNAGGIAGLVTSSEIIEGQVYSSYISAQVNAGGIAAKTEGTGNKITDGVSSNNNIFAEPYIVVAGIDAAAGGLIGHSTGTSVSGGESVGNTVWSQRYTAGLIGVAYTTVIDGCFNTSTVTGYDGISFEDITSLAGINGVDGIAGTDGVAGKNGETGINGGAGGNAAGLVCLFDFSSSMDNCFNSGTVTAGAGGNGGNGGQGGLGGDALYGAGGNGGSGGNGGVGGNGGQGGSAGGIIVYFLNNGGAQPYTKITNTFTRPGQVSLGESAVNGGVPGNGGAGGLGGKNSQSIKNGADGKDGAEGNVGDNGSAIRLRNAAGSEYEYMERTPRLNFDYDGGTGPRAYQSVEYGSPFGALPSRAEIHKAGQEFTGWVDGNGNPVTANTLFLSVEDITVAAVYAGVYTVTAWQYYGSTVSYSLYAGEQILPNLVTPSRDGFAFDGWYTNDTFTTPLDPNAVAANINVYAKWLSEVTINFVTTGGSGITLEMPSALNNYKASMGNSVTRVMDRPLGDLPTSTPNDASLYFGGWYRNLNDTGSLVAATTVVTGNLTLSARWNPNAYLEYNLMGGDGINECSPVWNGSDVASAYNGGNGTAANPYQIATAAQLKLMANQINASTPVNKASHFILTDNIDLGGYEWTPIGTGAGSGTRVSRFEGNFNGNGFYIKNLRVSVVQASGAAAGRYFLGFFGAVYNATISRVGLERTQAESKIELSLTGFPGSSSRIAVGTIAGYAAGTATIDQCYSDIPITVNVINPSSNFSGTACIGGLIGLLDNGSYWAMGSGWSASATGSTFRDSYYNGDLLNYNGIGNKNNKGISSYFSYNSGNFYNFVGGIIGFVFKSKFLNVFNTARVDISTISRANGAGAVSFAGGICGEIQNGPSELTNCFNTGYVSAVANKSAGGAGDRRGEVGGVVAHLNNNDGTITVRGCKNYGDLEVSTSGATTGPGGGRDIGGVIGLITGTLGRNVTGDRNYYKANSNYYGICSHNNGTYRSTSGNNNTPGNRNGNNLSNGVIQLKAFSSTSSYGTGDFEFTKTSYFENDTYFYNTSGATNWNFNTNTSGIWEFRLDRNDNLPMLKYMSYLTEYNSADKSVNPNRKYVYNGERVGRLITPVRTGFAFKGWFNKPVEFDPVLGELAYGGFAVTTGGGSVVKSEAVLKQNGFKLYAGKTATSLTDSNSTIYGAEGDIDRDRNIQIYAAWVPVPVNAVEVTLNGIDGAEVAGGGECASVVTAYRGYAFAQLYTPEKAGYVFDGWFAGGAQYYNTTVYTQSSATELTAHWTANSYTITLDANGGFVSSSVHGVTFDQPVGVMPIPYRFGYSFLGWKVDIDGTESTVDNNTLYRFGHDVTLEAGWQINSYTITFDKNSEYAGNAVTGTMEEQDILYGAQETLLTNGYSADGYEFKGWALSSDGGVVYTDGASYNMNTEGGKTLFAVWKANTYFVRMNTNGGEVTNRNSLIQEGEVNQFITLPEPKKAGYDFGGWYRNAEFDGAAAGGAITITGNNIELFAKWNNKTYTVVFDRNGGTGEAANPQTTEYLDGSAVVSLLSGGTPEKTGYSFGGWALEEATQTALYQNGGVFTINALIEGYVESTGAYHEVKLYAVWIPIPYSVAFELNAPTGGTVDIIAGEMADQIFYYNVAQRITVNGFAVTGYRFAGWNTQADGNGTDYADNALLTVTEGKTLYAQWEKVTYKIEYRSGADIGGPSDHSVQLDGSQLLYDIQTAAAEFTKTRSELSGWAFTSNAESGFAGNSLTLTASDIKNYAVGDRIILQAVWDNTPYLVKAEIYNPATSDFAEEVIIAEALAYGDLFRYDLSKFNKTEYINAGYAFVGFEVFDGTDWITVTSDTGYITITDNFFDSAESEDLRTLRAFYDAIEFEITGVFSPNGGAKNSVEYTIEEILVPGVSPLTRDSGMSFALRDISKNQASLIDINESTGEITVTANTVDVISFRIYAQHDNGNSALSDLITVTVTPKVITVADYTEEFTYNGNEHTVDYQLSEAGVTSSLTVNGGSMVKNAGTYTAVITVSPEHQNLYTFEDGQVSEEVTVTVKKAVLTVKGDNLTKLYYSNNPTNFTSKFSGFVGTDTTESLGLLNTVLYNASGCTKQSRVGFYTVYQSIPESILQQRLGNYQVVYQDGRLEVLPVEFGADAAVDIHTGPGGFVEGGKLYFDIEDINFGINGNFTRDDYKIIWEYKTAAGGWTKIEGADSNTLVLSEYRLGRSAEGLYFRVRLEGTGNLKSDAENSIVSASTEEISPAPEAPFLTENLTLAAAALGGFALLMIIVIIATGIRNRKLIKKIKERG